MEYAGVIMRGVPEVIASNFLPVIGEVSDLTEILLWVIVIWRTVAAVHRYSKRESRARRPRVIVHQDK